MNNFGDLVRVRTALSGGALEHVRRLVSTWRPLSDLSFSDLLLLAPLADEEGHRFVVLAQTRPTTGQTIYTADMVSSVVDEVERPMLTRVWRLGEVVEGDTPAIGSKERVRVQVIPVRFEGELVALLTREFLPNLGRRSGELERTYLDTFQRLAHMIADGAFPFAQEEDELETSPRVGDGASSTHSDSISRANPSGSTTIARAALTDSGSPK